MMNKNQKNVKIDSEEAYEKFIFYTFIQGTDQKITGKLEEDLAHQYDLGVNIYPCNLENATNIIINYKNYVNNPNRPGQEKSTIK